VNVRRLPLAGAVVTVLAAAGFVLGGAGRPQAHPASSSLTWAGDVRPIVERRCGGCHFEGGTRPDLTDFATLRHEATRVRRAVLERSMPPWPAVPGFGTFSNDRSLTSFEIDVLVSWIEGGGARGDAPESAAPEGGPVTADPETAPDVVIDPGAAAPVTAARQVYPMEATFPADRHIRGWRFYPGSVRHVLSARILVGGLVIGTWTPGTGAVFFPDGTGIESGRVERVVLDVEYREPAEPVRDRSRVAFYLGSGDFRPLGRLTLRPGEAVLDESIDVIELRTRILHGHSVRVTAVAPGGRVEPLLWTRPRASNLPDAFRLQTPVALPKGSRLRVWSFDGDSAIDVLYAPAPTAPEERLRGDFGAPESSPPLTRREKGARRSLRSN
jgi:hypothetical protein